MINPILSDKKNFVLFPQPSHIKSVEECEEKFQRGAYGCLPKVSLIFNGKQVLREVLADSLNYCVSLQFIC